MEIVKGKLEKAQKFVLYGPEGIGKSTFVSAFPEVLFIDTEGSTSNMDVRRTPAPSSFTMILDQVNYVKQHPNICKTLVIDTADWAEQLCAIDVCAQLKKKSIEDFGYGKGYVYLYENFGKLLNALTELLDLGIHVGFTAHAKMRKFEQPDEMGAYDRWEMKLSKQVAPIVKEWADLILFANYKTYVVNVDDQGVRKGKNKAQDGGRVMYTTHHSCWDAKNRHNLKQELPFDFKEIAHIFVMNKQSSSKSEVQSMQPIEDAEQQVFDFQKENKEIKEKEKQPVQDDGIPKALKDLMLANNVDEWDIQGAVASRGYYPSDTPIKNYDPEFINGVLVGAWQQVYKMILDVRETQKIPFNN